MLKISAYLLVVSVAFAGACAQTNELDPDGQTHWMTRCDERSDCGELECLCGVCTEACSASAACAATGGAAVCSSATESGACEADDVRVCLPACDRQADCDAVAGGLVCAADSTCQRAAWIDAATLEDAAVAGDSAIEHDGSTMTGTPIEVACSETLTETGGVELVFQDELVESFVVGADGEPFVIKGDDVDPSRRFVVQPSLGGVQLLVPAYIHLQKLGEAELFIAASTEARDRVVVGAIGLVSSEQVAFGSATLSEPRGLAFDADWLYWAAYVDADPTDEMKPMATQIWRSPREPGSSSELLAELDNDILHDSLQRVGDTLYFALNGPLGAQFLRVGGSSSSALDVSIASATPGGFGVSPLRINSLRADDTDVFLAVTTDDATLNRGIARFNPASGSLELLFRTEDEPVDLLPYGEHVYWVATADGQAHTLLRGRKDGSGDVEALATGFGYPPGDMRPALGAEGSSIYWIVRCSSEPNGYVVRMPI